ncbi:MAG TPA: hypothetical protein VF818_10420 [Ktedonobacterales bacterium]
MRASTHPSLAPAAANGDRVDVALRERGAGGGVAERARFGLAGGGASPRALMVGESFAP